MVKCKYKGCLVKASFGIKGDKVRFCNEHKTAIMVNIVSNRCEYDNCDIKCPAFGIKGDKARFCATHKTVEMVNVKTKRCDYEGCDIIPHYGIKGDKRRFCATHKTNNMIDVLHKRCEHTGCNTSPAFGIKGDKARFCVIHKTDGMVNVISKRCEHIGCNTSPAFGIKGEYARFCVKHKSTKMVNVVSKLCEYNDCDTRPNFDIKGGKGRFCCKHKTAEMIDVNHQSCEKDGCNIIARFDIKGGKGRFCAIHKTDGMVNVKTRLCEQEECEAHPVYGIPGNLTSYCSKHRKVGMIRRPNSKCSDCKEPALWGINWTPRHCETHKTSDDENLVERLCISCSLPYILDKDNKCENCNPTSWIITRLAKQTALMDYLDVHGLKGSGTDTTIDGGICGKERPDRIYDFGDKIIVLECDENQHQERTCICEQTRMVNIGQSFGGLPVYFLRWNPDDYSTANSRKKPEDIKKRYKLVSDLITDIKTNKIALPNGLVSALYMFYDDWSSLAEEKWKVITPFAKNEVINP